MEEGRDGRDVSGDAGVFGGSEHHGDIAKVGFGDRGVGAGKGGTHGGRPDIGGVFAGAGGREILSRSVKEYDEFFGGSEIAPAIFLRGRRETLEGTHREFDDVVNPQEFFLQERLAVFYAD
jgi:hypothetical protein